MKYACCSRCLGSDREHQWEDCPYGLAALPIAGMQGVDASTEREVAEAKIEAVLDWPETHRALLFTLLRAQGMDTDRARRILRDAKWERT